MSVEDFSDKQHVILSNIKNPAKLDDYFCSEMVDIAYVEEVRADSVKVITDVGTDLRKEDDRKWFLNLVEMALRDNDEQQAAINIVIER